MGNERKDGAHLNDDQFVMLIKAAIGLMRARICHPGKAHRKVSGTESARHLVRYRAHTLSKELSTPDPYHLGNSSPFHPF